jgi:hypothetical protein
MKKGIKLKWPHAPQSPDLGAVAQGRLFALNTGELLSEVRLDQQGAEPFNQRAATEEAVGSVVWFFKAVKNWRSIRSCAGRTIQVAVQRRTEW